MIISNSESTNLRTLYEFHLLKAEIRLRLWTVKRDVGNVSFISFPLNPFRYKVVMLSNAEVMLGNAEGGR